MHYLAIDIGSSFIKSALLNLTERTVRRIRRIPTPQLDSPNGETCELSVAVIAGLIRGLIEENGNLQQLGGVVLSVQMHGALFYDEDGREISNYISWQDKCAARTGADGLTLVQRAVRRMGPDTLYSVGNRINAGHTAAIALAWKENTGTTPARIALLGEAVLERLCGHPVAMHETVACSTGLYDVYRRLWSGEALHALGLDGVRMPPISAEGAPVCVYHLGNRDVPIYAAIGDQQAAMLGAWLAPDELMINIGTGAQVICRGGSAGGRACESRLMFHGEVFKTVAQLPGGRALNVLVRFVKDIGVKLFDHPDTQDDELWRRMIMLTNDDGHLPNLAVNLDFAGREGGRISGIDEGNLYLDRVLLSAYADMAARYEAACQLLGGSGNAATAAVISGGMGRKIPLLGQMIEKKLRLPIRYAPFDEDALAGLARLALWYSGMAADLEETGGTASQWQFTED